MVVQSRCAPFAKQVLFCKILTLHKNAALTQIHCYQGSDAYNAFGTQRKTLVFSEARVTNYVYQGSRLAMGGFAVLKCANDAISKGGRAFSLARTGNDTPSICLVWAKAVFKLMQSRKMFLSGLVLLFLCTVSSGMAFLDQLHSLRRMSFVALNVIWMYTKQATSQDDIVALARYGGQIRQVPTFSSRYNRPWYLQPRVRFPTLQESRFRILYSPLRTTASDGLGHGMSTINADVSTTLAMGLTYTHRIATHASLTRSKPSAVEQFFGWGAGELPRTAFQESSCPASFQQEASKCQVCRDSNLIRLNTTLMPMKKIVNLPIHLTYKRSSVPDLRNGARGRLMAVDAISKFASEHNESHTVFQMPPGLCVNSPAFGAFDAKARSFFFYKYWDAHGDVKPEWRLKPLSDANKRFLGNANRQTHRERSARILSLPKRDPVKFAEHELTFAIHARRGDFFDEKVRRPMISTAVFADLIRNVLELVIENGGIFSMMPVAVHIYSEGRVVKPGFSHDVKVQTKDYQDSDGSVRDKKWVENLLRQVTDSSLSIYGNSTTPRKNAEIKTNLFPNGLRVILQISTDTVEVLHQFASADVFIGSESAMSYNIAGSLSRGGVQLLPQSNSLFGDWCCHVQYNRKTGAVLDEDTFGRYWRAFVYANSASATRAMAIYKSSTSIA